MISSISGAASTIASVLPSSEFSVAEVPAASTVPPACASSPADVPVSSASCALLSAAGVASSPPCPSLPSAGSVSSAPCLLFSSVWSASSSPVWPAPSPSAGSGSAVSTVSSGGSSGSGSSVSLSSMTVPAEAGSLDTSASMPGCSAAISLSRVIAGRIIAYVVTNTTIHANTDTALYKRFLFTCSFMKFSINLCKNCIFASSYKIDQINLSCPILLTLIVV